MYQVDLINLLPVDENSYRIHNNTNEEQILYLKNLDYQVVEFYKNDSPITLKATNQYTSMTQEVDIYKITIEDQSLCLSYGKVEEYTRNIYLSQYVADKLIKDLNIESYEELSDYSYLLRRC